MGNIKNAVKVFSSKGNLLLAGLLTGVVGLATDYAFMFKVAGFFLALNVIDYYYGRKKAKHTNTLNSKAGAEGISKKFSYWVVIGIAFYLSYIFIDLGAKVGVDAKFLSLFGWFVLITYILNEVTSIVENLVALEYNVPKIFIKGLKAVKNAVDTAGDKTIPEK